MTLNALLEALEDGAEFTAPEIAARFGVSESTARSWLQQIRGSGGLRQRDMDEADGRRGRRTQSYFLAP